MRLRISDKPYDSGNTGAIIPARYTFFLAYERTTSPRARAKRNNMKHLQRGLHKFGFLSPPAPYLYEASIRYAFIYQNIFMPSHP